MQAMSLCGVAISWQLLLFLAALLCFMSIYCKNHLLSSTDPSRSLGRMGSNMKKLVSQAKIVVASLCEFGAALGIALLPGIAPLA